VVQVLRRIFRKALSLPRQPEELFPNRRGLDRFNRLDLNFSAFWQSRGFV
jgi:hypothetical protein